MGFLARITGVAKRTGEDPGYKKTSPATARRIRNILGIQQLQSLPRNAARAFQLASDPKASPGDFVEVIEQDEALGARVIRIANSVYFFRGNPATEIEKAVANIGLNELRCLLSAAMLRSMSQVRSPAREQVWANAIATAIACRMLSGYTKNINEGEAFLAGLMHDIGKLTMIQRAGDLYRQVIGEVATSDKDFVAAEEDIFETNHVEVGQWVAESSNFPDTIIAAIAHHHQPWAEDPKSRGKHTPLPLLIRVGDTIAHAAGIGHPSSLGSFQRRCQSQLPEAFAQIGMSDEDGQGFVLELESRYLDEINMYEGDFS